MARPVIVITGPYPTVEEVAATLGVSSRRVKQLEKMVERLQPKKTGTKAKTARVAAGKKPAAKKAAAKKAVVKAKGNR